MAVRRIVPVAAFYRPSDEAKRAQRTEYLYEIVGPAGTRASRGLEVALTEGAAESSYQDSSAVWPADLHLLRDLRHAVRS
jgi:hypothetical protein